MTTEQYHTAMYRVHCSKKRECAAEMDEKGSRNAEEKGGSWGTGGEEWPKERKGEQESGRREGNGRQGRTALPSGVAASEVIYNCTTAYTNEQRPLNRVALRENYRTLPWSKIIFQDVSVTHLRLNLANTADVNNSKVLQMQTQANCKILF